MSSFLILLYSVYNFKAENPYSSSEKKIKAGIIPSALLIPATLIPISIIVITGIMQVNKLNILPYLKVK